MADTNQFTTELAAIPAWNEGPPKIRGPLAFGAGLKTQTLLPVPTTGRRPLLFSADGFPEGLWIHSKTGVIQGKATEEKEATVKLMVNNDDGADERVVKVTTGGRLALTPPLGWNSWNTWATSIDEQKVSEAAQALITSGLAARGFNYVNIDDGWQGKRNGDTGPLQPNEKFPDMAALCKHVHSLGLRIGIYSTPWVKSYGGLPGGSSGKMVRCDFKGHEDSGKFLGERSHHDEDARQWAKWGFDFLKYDWFPWDVPETQLMREALRRTGRDIVYSLSNSAPYDKAFHRYENANCWRTTGDIIDTWPCICHIGFKQERWIPYTGPGHWSDPDMLVVGRLGWGNVRENRLTRDEQITHVTLWSMLSAPLLLGCDLTALDDFTIRLMCNDEVLEIDQDPLGRQAYCAKEVWTHDEAGKENAYNSAYAKLLHDGSLAVALFNRFDEPAIVEVPWCNLGIRCECNARDVWANKDLGKVNGKLSMGVPAHGAQLIRLSK